MPALLPKSLFCLYWGRVANLSWARGRPVGGDVSDVREFLGDYASDHINSGRINSVQRRSATVSDGERRGLGLLFRGSQLLSRLLRLLRLTGYSFCTHTVTAVALATIFVHYASCYGTGF